MSNKKLLHILSDKKFFNKINRFDKEKFDSKVVYISNTKETNGIPDEVEIFYPNQTNFKSLAERARAYHATIVYCLDYNKIQIVNLLPKKIKVFWVFFGNELYNERLDLMLSPLTLKIASKIKTSKSILEKIKLNVYHQKTKFNYWKCIKRINYIFLQSNEEYNFLSKYWKVPPFYRFPIDTVHMNFESNYKLNKKNSVIIGNSRSAFNNHIDIIKIIQQNTHNEAYQCILFLNYGNNNEYCNEIYNEVQSDSKVLIIDEFLNKDEFYSQYEHASALVINSYRQLAMHNIFTAIKYGCKIYLNDKNVTKDWLTKNEILVFSIDDFKTDYSNNNLRLTENQYHNNCVQLSALINNYDSNVFNNNLYNYLQNN